MKSFAGGLQVFLPRFLQKKPNPWGLYDMYGNVAEFVRDEHSEDYYANSPKEDPTGPTLAP